MQLDAGKLNQRISFQTNGTTRDPVYNTPVEGWTTAFTCWAEVEDVLPSRADRVAGEISIAARPARIRIRYRTDVDGAMRILFGSRVFRIVAGPAVIGNKDGLELMAEEYSTAGAVP